MSIFIFGHGLPAAAQVTARFRKRRPGPEPELVDWFLGNLPIDVPSGHRATVFLEPRFEKDAPLPPNDVFLKRQENRHMRLAHDLQGPRSVLDAFKPLIRAHRLDITAKRSRKAIVDQQNPMNNSGTHIHPQ